MNFILPRADVGVRVSVTTDANGDGSATFQFPGGSDYDIAYQGLGGGTLTPSVYYSQNGTVIGANSQNFSLAPPGDLAPTLAGVRVTGGSTLTVNVVGGDASTVLAVNIAAVKAGKGAACGCQGA